MSFVSLTLIFFLIMDPLGNVAYFIEVVDHIPKKQQRFIIAREMLIALGVMIFFYFLGDLILNFLEVSDPAVSLTSGTILFLVAIKIIFPSSKTSRIPSTPSGDPFIVPLAIPMVAGPALLATVMLFSHTIGAFVLVPLIISWLLASTILTFSHLLMNSLGRNGLLAIERIMGMVLILLAIQRFLEGIQLFASNVPR